MKRVCVFCGSSSGDLPVFAETARQLGTILAQLEQAVARRFLRPEHRSLLIVDEDAARLLDRLAAFRAPALPKWIDRGVGVSRESG